MIACAVVFFAGVTAASFALYDRFTQTNARRAEQARINARLDATTKRNAAANRRQDEALRQILCLGRSTVLASDQATREQKQTATDFYDQALKLIKVPPCPGTRRIG